MYRARLVAYVALSLLPGSTVWAGGLAVLGFELGSTSPEQVAAAVSGKGKITGTGSNQFSGGPMMKTDGAAFPVEGLTQVTFIFDPDRHLDGVVMKMDKSRFDVVLERLRAKYKVVSSDVPLVGNRLVKFHDGTTTIDLRAEHMSFEMTVGYIDDALWANLEQGMKKAAAEKEKKEAAEF